MSVNYDVICDELHIEVQAIVSAKEMPMSPKDSFIGERKKRQQAAGYSALKSLTTDIEAIDSPAEKIVINQE